MSSPPSRDTPKAPLGSPPPRDTPKAPVSGQPSHGAPEALPREAIASILLARALAVACLRRIQVGSLLVVEGDRRTVFGVGAPTATVRVRSPRMWPMLLRGSRGLAESYAQNLWDSPDLTAVIRLAARNAHRLDRLRSSLAPLLAPLSARSCARFCAIPAGAAAATSPPTTTWATISSRRCWTPR